MPRQPEGESKRRAACFVCSKSDEYIGYRCKCRRASHLDCLFRSLRGDGGKGSEQTMALLNNITLCKDCGEPFEQVTAIWLASMAMDAVGASLHVEDEKGKGEGDRGVSAEGENGDGKGTKNTKSDSSSSSPASALQSTSDEKKEDAGGKKKKDKKKESDSSSSTAKEKKETVKQKVEKNVACHHMVNALLRAGCYKEALPLAERVFKGLTEDLKAPRSDLHTMTAAQTLGMCMGKMGRFAEAEELFVENIAIQRSDPDQGIDLGLVESLAWVMGAQKDQVKLEQAEQLLRSLIRSVELTDAEQKHLAGKEEKGEKEKKERAMGAREKRAAAERAFCALAENLTSQGRHGLAAGAWERSADLLLIRIQEQKKAQQQAEEKADADAPSSSSSSGTQKKKRGGVEAKNAKWAEMEDQVRQRRANAQKSKQRGAVSLVSSVLGGLLLLFLLCLIPGVVRKFARLQ